MNGNIEFNNEKYHYLELRICVEIKCEEVSKKITQILNYFNGNNFIPRLTMIYSDGIRAENIPEKEDIPALTIDMRDNYLRFKYWTGSTTIWTYHFDDLIIALKTGTEEYYELYTKYAPISKIIEDFSRRFDTSIRSYSFKYKPDDELDIKYTLNLSPELSDGDGVKILFELLNKELLVCRGNELKFEVDYNILPKPGCSACEKAKRKREEAERKKQEAEREKQEEEKNIEESNVDKKKEINYKNPIRQKLNELFKQRREDG